MEIMQKYLGKRDLRTALCARQRVNTASVDTPVGCPYNIGQYALLTHLLAHVTDMEPDEFIWTGGDVHIYFNQIEQARIQVSRDPLPAPTVRLNPNVKSLFDFTLDDIRIEGYQSHEPIDYPVST